MPAAAEVSVQSAERLAQSFWVCRASSHYIRQSCFQFSARTTNLDGMKRLLRAGARVLAVLGLLILLLLGLGAGAIWQTLPSETSNGCRSPASAFARR